MPKIAIIGTTTWGMTLGVVLANKGLQVRLWARTEQETIEWKNANPNLALSPDITLPSRLSVTTSLKEALAGVK